MLDSDVTYSATFLKVVEIRKYTGNNVEPAALNLYKCLYTVAKSDIMYMYLYLRILHDKETDIKVPKHFKIVLLSSLRHLKIFNASRRDCTKKYFIYLFVKDIVESLDPLDYKTLHLLKILNQLVQKGDSVWDIDKLILNKLYTLSYATPLAPLRSLAVTIINTIELKSGVSQHIHFKPFLNIALITNYEDSRSRFSKISTEYILGDMEEYMKFIHKYFHFNVHNKTAGVVYKCIISRFNINEFWEHIWPFWKDCLEKKIEKREFSQSLVKYWIPYTVDCYGIDVYSFLSTQNINQSVLLQIIYELRRKKHISIESLYEGIIFETLLCCVKNKNTFEKSMEIFCTFPFLNEKISPKCLEVIKKYFLVNSDQSVGFEKTINRLLTHIFITEHVSSVKEADYKFLYDDFISKLSEYIIVNFRTRKNIYLSVKLCKNLIEIMKKPSMDFKLLYDLPKIYTYGFEENRYFLYLRKLGVLDLFTTKKNFITEELIKLFNEKNVVDDAIISLLIKEFHHYNIEDLKLDKRCTDNISISLHSLEKHKVRQKIIMYKIITESPEINYQNYLGNFIDQILDSLPNIKISDIDIVNIYEILKDLTLVVTGYEIKNHLEYSVSGSLGLALLDFMVVAVEDSLHEGLSIKTRKVLEYLFCSIIKLFELLHGIRTKYSVLIFNKLIILIEKSNIRKLVTDALNLTMTISEEIEASNCRKIKRAKRNFFVDLVASICNLNELESSKMRKHPRMRALLHVLCKGSGPNQKLYVQEAISKILVKLREDNLNPAVHTVILECLELLMAEPSFHPYTFTYAEEITKLSLKSFESKIWTVKNAAIKLTDILVSRFFGIQQTDTVRLRSFQEFCILFPKLTDNFFNILSRPELDEKAIVILQYIASSEVLIYEHLDEETSKKIKNYLFLFEELLVSNESFVIKFVPQAFVSLCPEKDYGYYLARISNFIIKYFGIKPSNIIVNHLLLFKEFVRKMNDNYSLLKNLKVNSEIAILDILFQLNNFLKVKTHQYLDLLNIRCFQLNHNCYTCICDLQLHIPMKKWYLTNFIHNLDEFQVFDQYSRIFNYLNIQKELTFLLEMFLNQYLNFIFDTEDLQVLSEMSNSILNQLFLIRYNMNSTLYKVLIEAILKIIIKFEDKVIFEMIPKNIKNINLYEAISMQIILANRKDLNNKELCIQSFNVMTKLRNFGNFDLDMLSKMLLVVQKNLNHIDKYLFLKLILYQVLSDREEEYIVELVSRLGLENVNSENCANKLLTFDFLYSYLGEREDVVKFLKDAMQLIEKFEKNLNICTFYLDTYDKLKENKYIVERLLQEINNC